MVFTLEAAIHVLHYHKAGLSADDPVGEALRLWWDLSRSGAEAKFLYFPDENHWILTPGNARIWYETVFAFLAQHVLGQQWQRPRLL